MENDVVSLFLDRKRQNISRYTELFIYYTLKKNVKLSNIINKIIEIYINHFYIEQNTDYSFLTKYFEIKATRETLMKDVLSSSLLFYCNSGLESQIKTDINTIVVLSNVIYLSLKLDSFVNEYDHADEEILERVEQFLNHFRHKIKISDEDMTLLIADLTKEIRKDVNAEKKFWKNLGSKNFILEYSHSLQNPHYLSTYYYYDIRMLKRYDENEVYKTSLTRGISDDILTIYLEQLSVFILKNLLNKHFDDYFFINVPSSYFDKNKDLISIESIFNCPSIRKRVIFNFDYEDIKRNASVSKTLVVKNFKLAINNIPLDIKLTANSFDMFDFVFIPNEVYDNYKLYHDIWNAKNINFIIDNGDFVSIKEDAILKGIR